MGARAGRCRAVAGGVVLVAHVGGLAGSITVRRRDDVQLVTAARAGDEPAQPRERAGRSVGAWLGAVSPWLAAVEEVFRYQRLVRALKPGTLRPACLAEVDAVLQHAG